MLGICDAIYNMKYDVTRSIKLNFSASNRSIVDEPIGKIDTKEERDSIFSKSKIKLI